MSLVARGLGIGYGDLLVTAGLGLSGQAAEVTAGGRRFVAPLLRIEDEDDWLLLLAGYAVVSGLTT